VALGPGALVVRQKGGGVILGIYTVLPKGKQYFSTNNIINL